MNWVEGRSVDICVSVCVLGCCCCGVEVRFVLEACGMCCVGDGVARLAMFGWRCKMWLLNAKQVCF